jgi:hypothetical protein
MILPNFTYSEFFKMTQNIMVRQRILLSGNFKEKREKASAVGYIIDYDPSPLNPQEFRMSLVDLETLNLNGVVELAFKEASAIGKDLLQLPVPVISPEKPLHLIKICAPHPKSRKPSNMANFPGDEMGGDGSTDGESDVEANDTKGPVGLGQLAAVAAFDTVRMSALCEDLETGIAEAAPSSAVPFGPVLPPSKSATQNLEAKATSTAAVTVLQSELLDKDGKVTISRMLNVRKKLQSQTSTHSERVIQLDKKFALRRAADETEMPAKMSHQEASQRVHMSQIAAGLLDKEKKARQLRWVTASKGLQDVLPPKGKAHFQYKPLGQDGAKCGLKN